jgi:hypothetical protein
MNFDVHLRLDISSDPRVSGKGPYLIHVIRTETAMQRWTLEGGSPGGFPQRGVWKWYPGSGGSLNLLDGTQQPFAILNPFMYPPDPTSQGSVYTPDKKGMGKWAINPDNPQNTPEATDFVWAQMKRNIWDAQGKPLGWHLTTSRGITFSGGARGAGVELTPYGTIYLERSSPPSEERSFEYQSIGVGFMKPGFGVSVSAHDFPSCGTELTKGNLPISDPPRLEDLEGYCLVVGINSAVGIVTTTLSGGGGGALGIIFGVPGRGLAIGAYKACGWVMGVTGNAGRGLSAGIILNWGYLTYNGTTKRRPGEW